MRRLQIWQPAVGRLLICNLLFCRLLICNLLFHSLLFCNLLSIPKKSTRICIVQCSYRGGFAPPRKSIRRFRNFPSEPRRPARSSGVLGALSRSKLFRSRPPKNFRRPRRHFERAFSFEQCHWGSILACPDAPGSGFAAPRLDFRDRNNCFSNAPACARSCEANMLLSC